MPATTASTDGIALVREMNDVVFTNKEYDRMEEFQTPDYVQHGPLEGVEIRGTEAATESIKGYHAAFPDLVATEEFSFTDGEYVCTRYTYRGTHDGEFMGVEPTGVTADISGTVVNRLEDGKIAESWVTVDFASLLQQVGVLPALEPPAR